MNKTNKNCNLKNFFKGFISFGNLSFINHKSNQINKFNNIDYNFNNVASIISKNFNKLLKNKNEEKNVNFGIRNKKNRITNTPNKFLSFPSPAILESYEEIYPGFTEKLLELTKIEQNQRENYNKNLIKSMNFTIRISQVLSFIFSILVLYTSVNFFKNGLVSLGAVLFITWFVFLLILNIKYKKTA